MNESTEKTKSKYEYVKKWRENNPEKFKAQRREAYQRRKLRELLKECQKEREGKKND